MGLTKEFKKVTDVQIYNLTDRQGRADPLGGWLLDMRSNQCDIVNVYWNDGYYLDSKRHGFVSHRNYQDMMGMYFSINSRVA